MAKKRGPREAVREALLEAIDLPCPVDITLQATTVVRLPPLIRTNFRETPSRMKITNNGSTAVVSGKWSKIRPYISGSISDDKYVFSTLHFHWGETDLLGSEHSVNGERFPLEMHIVYFKAKYQSYGEATKYDDGIVFEVYFFYISNEGNGSLAPITGKLGSVSKTGTSVQLQPMSLDCLIPDTEGDYFTYSGRLISEEQDTKVIWIINRRAAPVSKIQMAEFRTLRTEDGQPLLRNFHQLYPRSQRRLYHVNPSNYRDGVLYPHPKETGLGRLRLQLRLYPNSESELDGKKYRGPRSKHLAEGVRKGILIDQLDMGPNLMPPSSSESNKAFLVSSIDLSNVTLSHSTSGESLKTDMNNFIHNPGDSKENTLVELIERLTLSPQNIHLPTNGHRSGVSGLNIRESGHCSILDDESFRNALHGQKPERKQGPPPPSLSQLIVKKYLPKIKNKDGKRIDLVEDEKNDLLTSTTAVVGAKGKTKRRRRKKMFDRMGDGMKIVSRRKLPVGIEKKKLNELKSDASFFVLAPRDGKESHCKKEGVFYNILNIAKEKLTTSMSSGPSQSLCVSDTEETRDCRQKKTVEEERKKVRFKSESVVKTKTEDEKMILEKIKEEEKKKLVNLLKERRRKEKEKKERDKMVSEEERKKNRGTKNLELLGNMRDMEINEKMEEVRENEGFKRNNEEEDISKNDNRDQRRTNGENRRERTKKDRAKRKYREDVDMNNVDIRVVKKNGERYLVLKQNGKDIFLRKLGKPRYGKTSIFS